MTVMMDQIIRTLGLAQSTNSEILALVLFVTVCSMALGWMTDGVMGDFGFGAFGNGLLTLLAGVVGLVAFSWIATKFYGRYPGGTELFYIVGLSSVFSVTALMGLAMVKKHST